MCDPTLKFKPKLKLMIDSLSQCTKCHKDLNDFVLDTYDMQERVRFANENVYCLKCYTQLSKKMVSVKCKECQAPIKISAWEQLLEHLPSDRLICNKCKTAIQKAKKNERRKLLQNPILQKTENYIFNYFHVLNFKNLKIRDYAIRLIRKAELDGLTSGRNPRSMAAAVIYISALIFEEKKTQSEVAKVAEITTDSLRNRYKELIERCDLEEKIKIKEYEEMSRR
jgi:hypothetical protein